MAEVAKDNGTEKKLGRLNYFEPNVSIGGYGANSDMIPYPYEDYCMAVDLRITVYDRYSCGLSDSNGKKKTYEFSTEKGSLSFFGGTSVYGGGDNYKYLTTNYTDISMKNPIGNTSECLGIESINITYESWFFPNVNIKFVDVRGATVMQPAESGYYNESQRAKTYQIYKSFFSFPYPLFELTVKGFYGKGVTYRLVISKTNIEFDSTNGNFIINADFIGHLFGLFADIPISYLAVAPYTSVGSKYWDDMVEKGNFWFLNSAGQKQSAMMRIPELNLLIASATTSFEAREDAARNAVELGDIDNKKQVLQTIIDNYKLFATDDGFYEADNSETCYLVNITDTKQFSETLNSFCANLDAYCSGNSKNYYECFGNIKNFGDGIEKRIVGFRYKKETKEFEIYEDNSLENKKIGQDILENGKDGVNGYISDKALNLINSDNISLYYFNKGTTEKYSDIIKEIEKEIDNLDKEKKKREEDFKKETTIKIENAIGFSPTIKNMYNYMFAHLDTFMQIYYEVLKKISAQLDSSDKVRKKGNYDINDTNIVTDTQKMGTKKTTGNSVADDFRGTFLPPFTAYYDNDGNGNGSLKWPGSLRNGDTDIEEVKLVEELLNASRMFVVEDAKAQKLMEEYQASTGDNGVPTVSDLSTNPLSFIPLTSYDFANNKSGSVSNPYYSLVNAMNNGDSSIIGDVMFRFALRYFYYYNMANGNAGYNYSDSGWYKYAGAEDFGRLEAINLFKAFGENSSMEFINFLIEYANGDETKADEFINYITSTKNSNPKITGAWFCDGESNGMKNIFEKDGKNTLKYVYLPENSEGLRFIPLTDFDINHIKEDMINSDFNEKYISTTNFDKFEGNTFFILEERDYLKTLFDNIKSEIDESSKQAKEVSEKRYGNWSPDQYGNLIKKDDTIKGYKNNTGFREGKEQSYYFKESVVDEKNDYSRSVLKALMFDSKSEQDKYYIKRPTELNDNENYSLFDSPIYWIQDDIIAKAYLFIQGVPILGKNCSIDEKTFNGITPKSILLREGAFYWYKEKNALVKVNGKCSLPKSEINGKIDYGKEEQYEYRSPIEHNKYTFISNYSDTFLGMGSLLDAVGGMDTETISPIPVGISVYGYFHFEFPKDRSKSRENYLKQQFIDWAEKKYSEIEPLLTNLDYYDEEIQTITGGNNNDGSPKSIVNSIRSYGNGLDISYFTEGKDKRGNSYSNEKITNAKKIQEFLHDLFFTMDTTFDYYNGFYDKNEMRCDVGSMKSAFKSFVEQLHSIYGDAAKEANDDKVAFLAKSAVSLAPNPFKSVDLKLSTYMTLKSLYDKWICASFRGEKTWRFSGKNEGVDNTDSTKVGEYELDRFMYVDNFFHDIGDRLKVSLTKVTEWLSSCVTASSTEGEEMKMYLNNKTLYEYMADVAVGCGGVLLALPQKYIFSKNFPVDEAFRPYPYSSNWVSDSTTYMFLYSYKPSEHLGDYDTGSMDMNGYSPNGDGVDLTDDEIIGKVFGDTDNGYSVPAFGVTFAKQNQSYFKNISLTTQTHGVTEVSLMNTMSIAARASQGPRETVLYGQDIYKVYSNYSYECTVEMLGDMQIFPLMYFQLNNVPMWKGGYLIQKVSHTIVPGNITTKFTGVRQNRFAIPMADAELCAPLNENNGSSNSVEKLTIEYDNNVSYGGQTDIVGNKNYTMKNNDKSVIDISDINTENVTEKKPIICLTPAHGPKTQKYLEWAWSSKLIDDYIIPKLKSCNFLDGTSYSNNIHRCNVGGKNTGKGYSCVETREMINKFGSKCVISLVPHWNGCGGKSFMVFYGKAKGCEHYQVTDKNGNLKYDSNGKPVMWWRNCTGVEKMREDSRKFGEFCRESARNIVNKSNTYTMMPDGMMGDGVKTERNGDFNYLLTPDNTDGAPMLDCACVLTENFFADYKTGSIKWTDNNYNEIKNGKYQTGRAWLESDEGSNAIAELTVNAIVNYINSLWE